jgi:hypothetical protein
VTISYQKLRITIISRIIIETKTTKLRSHSMDCCCPWSSQTGRGLMFVVSWKSVVARGKRSDGTVVLRVGATSTAPSLCAEKTWWAPTCSDDLLTTPSLPAYILGPAVQASNARAAVVSAQLALAVRTTRRDKGSCADGRSFSPAAAAAISSHLLGGRP